jgi:hypothetical protein
MGNTALARQLVSRLERLSADSYYAHQASGVRGALLRELAQLDNRRVHSDPPSISSDLHPFAKLDALIQLGFNILEKAAQEL